jgi:hypothetical protein
MITEQPKQPSNNFTMRMVDEEQAHWTFLILIKVYIYPHLYSPHVHPVIYQIHPQCGLIHCAKSSQSLNLMVIYLLIMGSGHLATHYCQFDAQCLK